MVAEQITDVRRCLRISQVDFGKLLGAHPMTVSRWERDVSPPSPWQLALIREFIKAAMDPDVPKYLPQVIADGRITDALYFLLRKAKNL